MSYAREGGRWTIERTFRWRAAFVQLRASTAAGMHSEVTRPSEDGDLHGSEIALQRSNAGGGSQRAVNRPRRRGRQDRWDERGRKSRTRGVTRWSGLQDGGTMRRPRRTGAAALKGRETESRAKRTDDVEAADVGLICRRCAAMATKPKQAAG
jgi:hypothetical protein